MSFLRRFLGKIRATTPEQMEDMHKQIEKNTEHLNNLEKQIGKYDTLFHKYSEESNKYRDQAKQYVKSNRTLAAQLLKKSKDSTKRAQAAMNQSGIYSTMRDQAQETITRLEDLIFFSEQVKLISKLDTKQFQAFADKIAQQKDNLEAIADTLAEIQGDGFAAEEDPDIAAELDELAAELDQEHASAVMGAAPVAPVTSLNPLTASPVQNEEEQPDAALAELQSEFNL